VDTVHAWVVPSPHRGRSGARQLLAAAGARVLGSDPSQLTVTRDASGQPVLRAEAGQVWVSLSYGPGVLAVAASLAGPVGIDLEGPAGREVGRLAERWFDAEEASWLRERPEAEQSTAFLLLWTAKEALGKALGTGLRGGGLHRRVPLPPVTDGSFQALPEGLWLAHPVLRAPLVLAIATRAPVSGIELHSDVGHVELARSTARSRTSLPVVVRGNCSKT
jgi:4'-phosphopantetheinyl transferase